MWFIEIQNLSTQPGHPPFQTNHTLENHTRCDVLSSTYSTRVGKQHLSQHSKLDWRSGLSNNNQIGTFCNRYNLYVNLKIRQIL